MSAEKPILELELYIIRHGQSMGNVGYGREDITIKEGSDPVLTEKGEEQADMLGQYLKNVDFDAVYSSALMRAILTANGILRYQKTEKELNILPYLTEVSINPAYEGLSMPEIRELCPTAVLADGVDPSEPILCYNEYSDEDGMYARAEAAMNYFIEKYKNGEKVAVVSHAAYMTYLIFRIMGFTKSPVFDIDINNTGITKVNFFKKGTNKYGDITFSYINSTAHLEQNSKDCLTK